MEDLYYEEIVKFFQIKTLNRSNVTFRIASRASRLSRVNEKVPRAAISTLHPFFIDYNA